MKELKNKASPSLLFGGGSFLLIFYKIIKLAKKPPKIPTKKTQKMSQKTSNKYRKSILKTFFLGGGSNIVGCSRASRERSGSSHKKHS